MASQRAGSPLGTHRERLVRKVVQRWAELLAANKDNATDKALVATAIVHGLTLVSRNAKDTEGLGAPVLDPARKPAKKRHEP